MFPEFGDSFSRIPHWISRKPNSHFQYPKVGFLQFGFHVWNARIPINVFLEFLETNVEFWNANVTRCARKAAIGNWESGKLSE